MKIGNETLTILSTALRFDGDDRAVIVQKLERKAYEAVNKVLEGLGGKWSKKAKAHIFVGEERPEERIERVLATGEVSLAREDFAFFPTPVTLAQRLVKAIGVGPGHSVLEPSAGTGRLVDACLHAGAREVVCVERNVTMRNALERAIDPKQREGIVIVATFDDFMNVPTEPGLRLGLFDRVAMNPPFQKVGKGDHIDHVQHAFKMLKPGGKLGAIMPSGIEFREDRRHREFRDFVDEHGGEIASLPEGSFRESGTGVNTCIVYLTRS